MIKLTDYIVKFLEAHQIKHVFMVTGGGAMHLNDSFGKAANMEFICNHHEQACAIASEGYARYKGSPAAICVTSGPGGTNSITGVLGEWVDSVPAMYFSGQVRYDTTVASTGLALRQFGSQEADIVSIIRPITKYAVMVTDPASIRYHLEKAYYLATTGRPGPVWLDIPLNVQGSMIDETNLRGFAPSEMPAIYDLQVIRKQIKILVWRLMESERPLLIAGTGIRLSGAQELFIKLIEKLNIPVQLAIDAIDLIPSNHRLYAGRPGIFGQRGANLSFQNCDLLLSIGCSLTPLQIGYNFKSVARAAYKVAVDFDCCELEKPTMHIDLPIHSDPYFFISEFLAELENCDLPNHVAWLSWCKEKLAKYPVILPSYASKDSPINPYIFIDKLSNALAENDIIVCSNAFAANIPIQALEIKNGQRFIVNVGCGNMGYGLPSAIGACIASDRQRTICLEGDGSLQLNIQELQTVFHHQLPLKIFVFNNGGYLSIRSTQENLFNGFLVGESKNSGLSFPDYVKVANAYGIPSKRATHHAELKDCIEEALSARGPFLCDVTMDPEQKLAPRIISKRLPDGRMVSPPLEDLWPFLDRKELEENMIIPLIEG
jgi:acetolactate synthase-1/2/3 large subunit